MSALIDALLSRGPAIPRQRQFDLQPPPAVSVETDGRTDLDWTSSSVRMLLFSNTTQALKVLVCLTSWTLNHTPTPALVLMCRVDGGGSGVSRVLQGQRLLGVLAPSLAGLY